MRVAVLGAGSWGTALAALLAEAEGGGHDVVLWGRDEAAVARMQAARENARYLPGRRLPASLTVTADLPSAVRGCGLAVFAVPSEGVRQTATQAAMILADQQSRPVVACASKGLEAATRSTLDRVLAEALPDGPVVLLSGPTFAAEVARGLPAAAVAASRDAAAAQVVQRILTCERFRVYTTEDVIGVAIGGALKNVIAIAAGCSDGLGFGDNARAAIITRGLSEVGRLAARLGANPLTLAGLAGLGDLVLTCTGELSRNRKVGLGLGRGQRLPEVVAGLGQVAEGIGTARIARDLARALNVEMPITCQVAALVHDGKTPHEVVAALLSREAKPERG